MKLDLYLTLHTKTDSEGIEDGEWGLTGSLWDRGKHLRARCVKAYYSKHIRN